MARRQRTIYGATVFVLLTWLAFATVAHFGRSAIVPEENLELANNPSRFLAQAADQKVRWRTMDSSVFTDARRQGRPIFLLLGTGWSRFSADYDALFLQPDVAERLNRDFLCVRVDLTHDPAWSSVFLPLTRAARRDAPGFQMVVLTPEARLIDSPSDGELAMSDRVFLAYLQRVQARAAQAGTLEGEEQQAREIFLLRGGSTGGALDVTAYLERMALIPTTEPGAFLTTRGARIWPQEWLLMAESGERDEANEILRRIIRSPMTDWLEGGFFIRAAGNRYENVEFAKTATGTAALLDLISFLQRSHPDPAHRLAGERAFDFLLRDTLGDEGKSYFWAQEDTTGRSERYSFNALSLNERVGPTVAEYARTHLGLNVQTNPRMSVTIARPEALMGDRVQLERVLRRLNQENREAPMESGGVGAYWIQAQSLAAMLRFARRTDDVERIRLALDAARQHRLRMRTGLDEVVAGNARTRFRASLFDYLSYADMAWEAFVTSGDVGWREDGETVLNRALFLFGDAFSGLHAGVPPDLLPTGAGQASSDPFTVAEVVDTHVMSASGLAFSTVGRYAALAAPAVRERMMNRMLRLESRVQMAASQLELGVGGLMRGSLALRSGVVIALGRVPLSNAAEATADIPVVRVPWRQDLRGREPGLYRLFPDGRVEPLAGPPEESESASP